MGGDRGIDISEDSSSSDTFKNHYSSHNKDSSSRKSSRTRATVRRHSRIHSKESRESENISSMGSDDDGQEIIKLITFARWLVVGLFFFVCVILAYRSLDKFDTATADAGFVRRPKARTRCVSNLEDGDLMRWLHNNWEKRSPQREERVCQALTSIGGVDTFSDLSLLNASDIIEIARLGKVSIIDRKMLREKVDLLRSPLRNINEYYGDQNIAWAETDETIVPYRRVWKQFETTHQAHKMKQVTINEHGTIVAINEKDEILYGSKDVSEWKQMDGSLKQIDIGGENGDVVVGVNLNDHIWTRRVDGRTGQPTSAWKHVDGLLSHASVCGNGAVWGVNGNGHVFYRASVEDGLKWVYVYGLLLKQISCDKKTNEVYGVNGKDEIFVRRGVSTSNWIGVEWKRVFGRLRYISSGNGVVVGVNGNADAYEMTDEKKDPRNLSGWKKWDGKLRHIEVSSNGEFFAGIDEHGAVYSRCDI